MPKNEDGEFELILGNRQMMSVFFIVVLLFGVIFAIGYILGRNSGPATEMTTTAHKSEKAVVVPSPAQSTPSAAEAPAPEPPKHEEKKAEPEKKAEAPKPEPPKAEVKKAEAPKPEPTRAEIKKEAKAEKKATPPSASGQPAPGMYLQLAATKREEAELEVDVLRKKGFKAMAAQHPENPILFRVLVGPLAKNDINKMKTDLKNAGFPGDHAIPKTF